ncbi:MAG: phosphoribosylaminoimidazolecarboxamide formyltransferase [Ruminococcaceae bacterium]|nr:phosphoribosylaminoimidazolecarboxamide formyltransferase [Oscillospiraceae bacterium]
MNELLLKYGCNPNQVPAKIFMEDGSDLPVEVLNGRPGYINFLDALNAYQLVKELKEATGLPAAASFKHVSPAGAAVACELSDTLKKVFFVDDLELSPIASAYAAARGADRMSSYGDFAALSDTCDEATAKILSREVSDGVIAPDYTPEALAILQKKRKGGYTVLKMDPSYVPEPIEWKNVYGITFEQGRNDLRIDAACLENIVTENKTLSEDAKTDLLIALITLKYTQSNSVCYVKNKMAIGIGAGQQSRIHCTRLAGNKADIWHLRAHDKVLSLPFKDTLSRAERDNTIDVYIGEECDDVLRDGAWQNYFTEKPAPLTREEKAEFLKTVTGVSVGSDAFFPFGDNIERVRKSGVSYVAQPGGSIRDDHVIDTCNRYGIAMAFTGIRLFHH